MLSCVRSASVKRIGFWTLAAPRRVRHILLMSSAAGNSSLKCQLEIGSLKERKKLRIRRWKPRSRKQCSRSSANSCVHAAALLLDLRQVAEYRAALLLLLVAGFLTPLCQVAERTCSASTAASGGTRPRSAAKIGWTGKIGHALAAERRATRRRTVRNDRGQLLQGVVVKLGFLTVEMLPENPGNTTLFAMICQLLGLWLVGGRCLQRLPLAISQSWISVAVSARGRPLQRPAMSSTSPPPRTKRSRLIPRSTSITRTSLCSCRSWNVLLWHWVYAFHLPHRLPLARHRSFPPSTQLNLQELFAA